MSFYEELQRQSWESVAAQIGGKTDNDVLAALQRSGKRSLDDFMALISPAAVPHLEELARLSHELTLRRFGKTIQLYIPLYLSNACTNICTYCGFSQSNRIARHTLTHSFRIPGMMNSNRCSFSTA